jgi:hypothetical protein
LALFFFSRPFLLLVSALLFGFTLATYHAYQIFTPLFLLGLTTIYRKVNILATITFLLLAGFIFRENFTGNTAKSSIAFFSDPQLIHQEIELPRMASKNLLLGKIFYNKPIVFSRLFLEKYLASFSPQFLINGGQHPIHNFPGIGNIFFLEYPFFILGIYFLFKQKNKGSLVTFWWLIVAPIASALTKDAPNSARLTPEIIPLIVCIGFGIIGLSRKTQKFILGSVMVVFALFSLFTFYHSYFLDFPVLRAANWGGGYQQLINFLNLPENRHKQVLMQRPSYSPYIYFLFYNRYDPAIYQQEAIRYPPTNDGFSHVSGFDRYEFADFNLKEKLAEDKILVVWAETVSRTDESLFDVYEQGRLLIKIPAR